MVLVKLQRRTPRAAFATFPGLPTLDDLESRIGKFLDGTVASPLDADLLPQTIGWLPATEISEAADELLMTLELPGMDRNDIDISVDEGVLTVRGEKTEEKKEEGEEKKYYLFERSYGTFQRSFTLPRSVDANTISGEFDKGVLKVHMPKTFEAKAKGRKIEIGAAK